MAKKNFYCVKKGLIPGIYKTWDECQRNVNGFPSAEFKGFATLTEAEDYMTDTLINVHPTTDEQTSNVVVNNNLPDIYAFVDGSFNSQTNVYGYGGFLVYNGQKEILQGNGNEPEMATMRNVAGEVLGSKTAIYRAICLGLPKITIYYDYSGIEKWATGEWKRNKVGTKLYYDFIQDAKKKIDISFVHVKGHSGIDGNEEADRRAKEAVGI